MDILITVGIFPPDIGGPASFVPKIAKYLINKGHNVKIICLSDKQIIFMLWPLSLSFLAILGTKLAGPPTSGGKIPTVINMSIIKFYI